MEKRHLRKDARYKRTEACHAQSIPKEDWDNQAFCGETHTQEPIVCPAGEILPGPCDTQCSGFVNICVVQFSITVSKLFLGVPGYFVHKHCPHHTFPILTLFVSS